MYYEGRKKILELKKSHKLIVNSLTGDCFMEKPFWKVKGELQHKLKLQFISIL